MLHDLPSLTRLHQLQRERGICSEPDCDLPIEGWCATCDQRGPFKAPKWCAIHLALHCGLYRHTGHYPYLPYDHVSQIPDWLQRQVERTLGTPGAPRDWPD